jgi:hypothetical protein
MRLSVRDALMLRDVIVHIANEQPFMVDLLEEPGPGDVSLICRSMRTMSGKKPVFVEFSDSTFLLPVSQIRFIEIPARAYEHEAQGDGEGEPGAVTVQPRSHGRRKKGAEADDSDVAIAGLRRVGQFPPEQEPQLRPEPEPVAPEPTESDELDVELLRRIHEA